MPSEKCAVGWGSDDDEMRMITASFVRAIERFAGALCLYFLPLFQQVVAIRKTCNQLSRKNEKLFDKQQQVLAAYGWKINTAFVERLNLDLRQRVAAVGRRVTTLCQGEDGLQQQLVLFQTYHNFVLPHASLRQALRLPEATNGNGSARLWRPCTPAMAAGLTDHVWSLNEVLLCRVPPWPQTQMV